MDTIMAEEQQHFDRKSALQLLNSKEAGIALLPLAEMEQPQATLFWAAIFFGIFTAILGSLLSLLTTSYSNSPVIYILGLFLVSYLAFFLVFTIRGFSKRKQLYKRSLEKDYTGEDSIARRLGAIERRIHTSKVHQDLGRFVFDKARTISYEEYNTIVNDLMGFAADDARLQNFNQNLVSAGIITIDRVDPDHWTVTYDAELVIAI